MRSGLDRTAPPGKKPMARPSPADLLQRIEFRHRDLLEQLDQFNDQVVRALEEFSSEERVSPSNSPGPAETS